MSELKSPQLHGKSKVDLTQGDLNKHLLRLTLPMSWGIMMIISFQLIDTYFVSRLGTQELAAFSFTFPVAYVIFTLMMGFSIATSSVVSRLIGAGDMDSVRRVVSHGLVIVLLLSITISVLGLIFLDPLFRMLGAGDDILPLIRDYMVIWFLGAVFISTPMVENSAMRACGDAITPAIIMTFAAVANLILDPLLIFGLWGFPELGLKGAAIATVIANAGALAIGLYAVTVKKKILSLRALVNFSDFSDSAKRLCFIAIPAGLTQAVIPITNGVIVALLSSVGAEAVAAFGVVSRVEAFAFVVLMGLSVGMAPIIGQNFGARKIDRVTETLKKAISFNIIWSVFIAVLLGAFAYSIARIFSDDPEVIAVTVLFFWVVPFSYALSNLLNGWSTVFNAVGVPQNSVMIVVVKYLVLLLPAVYIGHYLDGARGIFIAIAAVNVVAGVLLHYWSWIKYRRICTG